MERKLGHFVLADFYAERRYRKHPSFLDAVEQLLDWSRIECKLKKKLRRSEENCAGVKAYPALCMFKILLLQSWYDLSDLDMEMALYDRYSFSRFVGLSGRTRKISMAISCGVFIPQVYRFFLDASVLDALCLPLTKNTAAHKLTQGAKILH